MIGGKNPMIQRTQQRKEKIAGILQVVTALLSLVAAIFWFRAKHATQGAVWLAIASISTGLAIANLRQKKPAVPTTPPDAPT